MISKRKSLFLVLFFVSSLMSWNACSMEAVDSEKKGTPDYFKINEIKKEQIYSTEIYLSSGERVFFYMERVNLNNADLWQQYWKDTKSLAEPDCGAITKLIHYTHSHKEAKELLEYISSNDNLEPVELRYPYNDDIKNITGFTEGENNDYWNRFSGRLLDVSMSNLPLNYFVDITNQNIPKENSYVVYASKLPVEGHYPLPPIKNKDTNLKEFYQDYGNILVSALFHLPSEKEYYMNSSIINNVKNVIEGEYMGLKDPKELILYVYAFSAAVARTFKDKKALFISANLCLFNLLTTLKWNGVPVFEKHKTSLGTIFTIETPVLESLLTLSLN